MMRSYEFHPIMKAPAEEDTPGAICIYKYRFKNRLNTTYIVNAVQYERDIFAIKFFSKAHSDSPKKYRLLTGEYDARAIITTVVRIALDVYIKFPMASFTFIGVPTEEECCFVNTKRYRLYKMFANFFIDPDSFIHGYDENNSAYILLNLANPQIRQDNIEELERHFGRYYDVSLQISMGELS